MCQFVSWVGKVGQVAGSSFTAHNVTMIEPDCLLRGRQVRDPHHTVRIQMRNKPIPVTTHGFYEGLEFGDGHAKMSEEPDFKARSGCRITDDLPPGMFPFAITQELAPFENA